MVKYGVGDYGRDPAVEALLECSAITAVKPLLEQDDPAVLEGATSVIALLCVPFEGKEEAVKVRQIMPIPKP